MAQLIRLRQVHEEPDSATSPDMSGPASTPTQSDIPSWELSVLRRDDTELRLPLARVMLLYAHACLSAGVWLILVLTQPFRRSTCNLRPTGGAYPIHNKTGFTMPDVLLSAKWNP